MHAFITMNQHPYALISMRWNWTTQAHTQHTPFLQHPDTLTHSSKKDITNKTGLKSFRPTAIWWSSHEAKTFKPEVLILCVSKWEFVGASEKVLNFKFYLKEKCRRLYRLIVSQCLKNPGWNMCLIMKSPTPPQSKVNIYWNRVVSPWRKCVVLRSLVCVCICLHDPQICLESTLLKTTYSFINKTLVLILFFNALIIESQFYRHRLFCKSPIVLAPSRYVPSPQMFNKQSVLGVLTSLLNEAFTTFSPNNERSSHIGI